MRTVAVVNYGMGNLRSVTQAVLHVAHGSGVNVVWARRPEEVMAAERVVLPGQGAMRDCMRELHQSGMYPAVMHAAANKPLMGVCVGMQMLLDRSEEGPTESLGLIAGDVVRFQFGDRKQPDGSRFKVPQIGWNQVRQSQPHPMWAGVAQASWFYFVHSFYARTSDARHSVGEADYGGAFTAAIGRDNIFATQFHPEKSAESGLVLYRNFLHWNP